MDDYLSTRIKEEVRKIALQSGFCLCGFTIPVIQSSDFLRYEKWLDQQNFGEMTWMTREDHIAKRQTPLLILPSARSIMVLGTFIHLFPPDQDIQTASFAHYQDYHVQISNFCKNFLFEIQNKLDLTFESRICIDSSPILERSLAVQAGLGWIGKSGMLINPIWGSAIILSECLISLPFQPDQPFEKDFCGECRACIAACPSACIQPQSRTINAGKCISYLTIEKHGKFSKEEEDVIGKHVFGCDICTEVCPWNNKNSEKSSPLLLSDFIPSLSDIDISNEIFKEKFRESPIFRLKNERLQRNIKSIIS